MVVNYLFIALAAVFWGVSGVLAKWLFLHAGVSPLTVSQTRVLVGWATFFLFALWCDRRLLAVSWRDVWKFILLGVIGVAGANFGLYFAISLMDAAVADLIQFTAPLLVALWVWTVGRETFDGIQAFALVFVSVGLALTLGLWGRTIELSWLGVASAFASALAYAWLILWGQQLSRRYPRTTVLHYSMASAAMFWFVVQPPHRLWRVVETPNTAAALVALGLMSVTIPYTCFFTGLSRVSAAGAGIVSTLEPPVMALGACLLLGEKLSVTQILGMILVLAGVSLVELQRGRQSRSS